MTNRFVLGTVQFGLDYGINNPKGKPSQQSVFDILTLAHQKGITQLDSADAYGNAQQTIGNYISATGKKFKVNSKFHVQGEKQIPEQLETTLNQLQVEKLHVYFFHRFDDMLQAPQSLSTLQELKQKNLINYTGVSIYTNEELAACIEKEAVDVIQLPFNLLDNFSKRGALIKQAKEKGKLVQVRSVFLQGLFFKDLAAYPPKLLPLAPYVQKLKQIAKEINMALYDLAIAYVLAKKEIDQIIIGIDTQEQLEKNLAINTDKLSKEVIAQIDQLSVKEEELLYPYNW